MVAPALVDTLERLLAEGEKEEVLVASFREVVRAPPAELEMLRSRASRR